jgi:glycerophosphoryl diester phosphodiesterase
MRGAEHMAAFELQGHRGARGLKPENTLPSFEAAMDCGVSAIETDVHLTADNTPVLFHDSRITERLCRVRAPASVPSPSSRPLIRSLRVEEIRSYVADQNPDPVRFPTQDATPTPLAAFLARTLHMDPFSPPTLFDLFMLADLYQGERAAKGREGEEQKHVRKLRLDLEIKRVPWNADEVGGPLDGTGGLLEEIIEDAIHRNSRWLPNINVRSFDHRSVRLLRQRRPLLTGAVLIEGTTPVDPVAIARAADAQIYCPEYRFLDRTIVDQCHAGGIRVIPWTVNDEDDLVRLLEWGIDGVTTDYPDRMADLLRRREIEF